MDVHDSSAWVRPDRSACPPLRSDGRTVMRRQPRRSAHLGERDLERGCPAEGLAPVVVTTDAGGWPLAAPSPDDAGASPPGVASPSEAVRSSSAVSSPAEGSSSTGACPKSTKLTLHWALM